MSAEARQQRREAYEAKARLQRRNSLLKKVAAPLVALAAFGLAAHQLSDENGAIFPQDVAEAINIAPSLDHTIPNKKVKSVVTKSIGAQQFRFITLKGAKEAISPVEYVTAARYVTALVAADTTPALVDDKTGLAHPITINLNHQQIAVVFDNKSETDGMTYTDNPAITLSFLAGDHPIDAPAYTEVCQSMVTVTLDGNKEHDLVAQEAFCNGFGTAYGASHAGIPYEIYTANTAHTPAPTAHDNFQLPVSIVDGTVYQAFARNAPVEDISAHLR